MKLEDAIEQLESTVVQALTPCQGWTNTEAQALRIVLERAKEKPVYVLGEEERKWIEAARCHFQSHEKAPEVIAALTAALALQEPFTRDEWMDIWSAVDAHEDEYGGSTEVAAKLYAYIEGLGVKANSSHHQS